MEEDERYLAFLKRISNDDGCYDKGISCIHCPLRYNGGPCKALTYMFENHPDMISIPSREKIGYYARIMLKLHSRIHQWKKMK